MTYVPSVDDPDDDHRFVMFAVWVTIITALIILGLLLLMTLNDPLG